MTVVKWKEGQTHLDFIRQLSSEEPVWEASLSVDEEFISAFLELSVKHAKEVAAALESAPVTFISLQGLPKIARCRLWTSWRLKALCGMLGSMVSPCDQLLCTNLAKIITSLQHVETMTIFGHKSNQHAMRKLAQGLAHHDRLKDLHLYIPSSFYPWLLPALYGIESLTELYLSAPTHQPEISLQVAQAMAGLLAMGPTNPKLRIRFSHWEFSNLESSRIFCQALAESSIRGIDLTGCCFVSPKMLAGAMTNSKLDEIKFLILHFTEGSTAEFLSLLARDISNLRQLEELTCGPFDFRDEFGSNDEAVVRLTHAVAQLHRLRSLHICFHMYSQHTDAALAECLKPVNAQLVELKVNYYALDSDKAPRITESPALLKALKTNYTLQRIELHSSYPYGHVPDGQTVVDPWDPDLKKTIEMFVKLNCAGRSYLTQDSMSKRLGCSFLGAINDDLDCLFYHLREENPSLCDRNKETGTTTL